MTSVTYSFCNASIQVFLNPKPKNVDEFLVHAGGLILKKCFCIALKYNENIL